MQVAPDPSAPIKSVVIVGGGTAGWMTAALVAKLTGGLYSIRLVESEEIGIIGVGEATIPPIKVYNKFLAFEEPEMMRATKGTYKLGIEFVNWRERGHSYVHGFGKIGSDLLWMRPHQFWRRLQDEGVDIDFDRLSINALMCRRNKFTRPSYGDPNSPMADLDYAYHFDAALYGQYLRGLAEGFGVRRTEGRIVEVKLHPETGAVDAVVMQSGETIGGDLFIDCSGQRGLLIRQALGAKFIDWSNWLLNDRAWAVPCENAPVLSPYTRSTARDSGWQWRIPLQHRIGNGHVFSSAHLSEDEAASQLLATLDGAPLAEPRLVRFTPGKLDRVWIKNCVAIGLASGFLEPLESTSIHLIQTAILRLISLFPGAGFDETDIVEYNRQTDLEYGYIRNFIIAHYKVTNREDTPYWAYCKNMSVPEDLRARIDLFAASGRFFKRNEDLFGEESWTQVLLGQGLQMRYDPNVAIIPIADVRAHVDDMLSVISDCVDTMETHQQAIDAMLAR